MSDCNCNNPVRDLTKGSVVGASQANALEFHPTTLHAQINACVSASYNNNQICVNFPIVGNICFSVSLPIPNGTEVKVCMETCGFRFGVPPFNGIKASVYLQNSPIWTGTIWGTC